MKKITAIILTLVMVLSCTVSVYAADTKKNKTGVETANLITGTGDGSSAREVAERYPAVLEYLADELTNNLSKYYNGLTTDQYDHYIGSKIDVSSFNIPRSEGYNIYQALVNEYMDLVYLNPTWAQRGFSGDKLTSIYPIFLFNTLEKSKEAVKKVNKSVSKYMRNINNDWDDFHKARALHDLVATQTEYHDSKEINNVQNDIEHSAYGVLVNAKAVCQGYSHAYGLLLDQCGIDNSVVMSPGKYDDEGNLISGMAHEWNMVKINGKFYHVDVTWDDPTEDTLGQAYHTFFLDSDNAINDPSGHRDWNAVDMTDTAYDNAWWKDVDTAIYYDNGKEYYIKKDLTNLIGYFTERDENGEERTLYRIYRKYWRVKDENQQDTNRAWWNVYSKLAYYDGYFYFNDIDNIYKMAPDDTEPTVVLTETENFDIYGISITFDGRLKYTIKETPNNSDVIYTYDLKNGMDRFIDTDLELDENDTYYSGFGINEPTSGYNGFNLLGVQLKSESETSSMRFISLISSDVLKNAREYGYIFTATSKAADVAKGSAYKLTIDNGRKFNCTGTYNTSTGVFGSNDMDSSSYKYVTAAVNNITDDKTLVARVYVIDNDGLVHYGKYIDSNDVKWDGCAAKLSDLG